MLSRLKIWVLVGFIAMPATAAVRVVRTVDNEGMAGMGASKKQSITWIAGDKHREEMASEGKPSMLERMAGVGKPVITRLDKQVVWTLNVPKKRYEERPLVTPQAESTSSKDDSESSGDSKPEKPTTRISKAEFKVTPLGQKKTFGAFVCDGYQLKALIEMEDLETKKKTEMRLVNTLWNAPETGVVAQLKKEETDYAKAYAKALGLTDSAQKDLATLGTTIIAAMAGAGEKELSGALAKMPAELKKIKGYPIHTRVEWYGSGNDREETEAAAESDGEEPIPTSLSGALGGLAKGLAKKKIEEKRAKPVENENGRLMMAMSSEITAISTDVPGDVFEIPAGFKKAN
jgi:hypothetical protein